MSVTAPAGRVYRFDRKREPAVVLTDATCAYRSVEHKPARWARVNPSQLDLFAPLWPGCVVADPRVQRNNLMLGVEEA